MHGSIPLSSEADHQDSVLIAELAEINTIITRYILRFLDADAGRAEPISIEEERALVDRAASAIDSLRARTKRRLHLTDQDCAKRTSTTAHSRRTPRTSPDGARSKTCPPDSSSVQAEESPISTRH
jgi:hypothetical protein